MPTYTWSTSDCITTAWGTLWQDWGCATWRAWASTTSTTSTANTAWTSWVMRNGTTTEWCQDAWSPLRSRERDAPALLSEEERTARQRQWEEHEAEQRARIAEQERARTLVRERATALLLAHLDDTQRQTYQAAGYFDVRTDDGQRTYRLSQGTIHNVALLDPVRERPQRTYCAHPAADLPVPDVLLAQKLALEADEAGFLRVANRHDLREEAPGAV